MTSTELDNMVKTDLLKREPPSKMELDGLMASGRKQLVDAKKPGLSLESKFQLAYNAAHSFALAALRRHGYRPNNKRYVTFQALPHTLGLGPEVGRVLSKCHGIRNSADYDGLFEIDEQLMADLLKMAAVVEAAAAKLPPITK